MSTLEATQAYWDKNVTNWKVATQEPDSLGFFEELEDAVNLCFCLVLLPCSGMIKEKLGYLVFLIVLLK